MKIFEKQHCGCGKKECYYCWLEGKIEATMAIEKRSPKTLEEILVAVCDSTGTNPADVISYSRKRDISRVRQIYCLIVRETTDITLQEIGAAIGGRDHSTVLVASKKAKDDIEWDKQTKKMYERVKSAIC